MKILKFITDHIHKICNNTIEFLSQEVKHHRRRNEDINLKKNLLCEELQNIKKDKISLETQLTHFLTQNNELKAIYHYKVTELENELALVKQSLARGRSESAYFSDLSSIHKKENDKLKEELATYKAQCTITDSSLKNQECLERKICSKKKTKNKKILESIEKDNQCQAQIE